MNKRVKIYVEGGGNRKMLKSACRKAFSKFFEKAGFKGRMPKIVACGSRNDAYDDFCTAVKIASDNELPLLLVDSEAPVTPKCQQKGQFKPWIHLWNRDQWNKPTGTDEEQAHFMVQCMEAWFLADRQCLEDFFGQGFNGSALPDNICIESVHKKQLFDALNDATRHSVKGKYGKSAHSFKILEMVRPHKVFDGSPWAERLRDKLSREL